MTQPVPPNVEELMAALGAVSGKLAGKEGDAIREHLQQLIAVLAAGGANAGDDARQRAGDQLEQLIAAVVQLVNAHGPAAHSLRGIDVRKLADGLRTFSDFLKAPTPENQAQAEQLIEQLQGSPFGAPVPLDQLKVDGTLELLAVESARRQGLKGSEARRAADRMKREVGIAIRRLELAAQDEASRATTAAQLDQLLDQLTATATPLAHAVAAERAALVSTFRSVDLSHMSAGLRTFAIWLSSPHDDPAAQVAALREQWTQALGPATHKDPARSDEEKRLDFERAIAGEIRAIFGGELPALH